MHPHSLVSSSADPDALAVLAQASGPLTGREVARRAGRSQDRIRQVLERLVEHGIVFRQQAGRARLYSLNRDHLAAPAIIELTELRALLVDRLRAELAAWDEPALATVLFGSAARGDGDLDSDIDLLIVRPEGIDGEHATWRAQLDRLSDRVLAWTGNYAGIVEIGAEELGDLIDRAPPVLESIRAEGIDLAGTRIGRLLREAR
jgi:predicted nucleotidyltransferase